MKKKEERNAKSKQYYAPFSGKYLFYWFDVLDGIVMYNSTCEILEAGEVFNFPEKSFHCAGRYIE